MIDSLQFLWAKNEQTYLASGLTLKKHPIIIVSITVDPTAQNELLRRQKTTSSAAVNWACHWPHPSSFPPSAWWQGGVTSYMCSASFDLKGLKSANFLRWLKMISNPKKKDVGGIGSDIFCENFYCDIIENLREESVGELLEVICYSISMIELP